MCLSKNMKFFIKFKTQNSVVSSKKYFLSDIRFYKFMKINLFHCYFFSTLCFLISYR